MLVENLHTYGSCAVPIQFSKPFTCQNFTLRDVYLRSEAPLKAAIAVSCEPEKLRNFRMERVYVENADYIFAVQELPVSDLGNALMSAEKYGYVLPFEFISLFLLACIIGGLVILNSYKKKEESK
mgnify:CR=1 FL=1